MALCLISLAPRAADAQAVQVVANCGTLNGPAPPLGSANGPVTVNQLGQLCASASVSASITGFAPNGNFANLTATNSSASVALPAGAVVIFQNTGTTTVSCTVGIGSATALVSEVQIPASSSVPFTVGSNTFGACIDQTGSASNVIALAGGAGLFTGFGGGGGGSGGAVTNAGTFAVQLTGATNNINNIAGTVSLPTGAATSALQTTGNTSLTTINTTLGTPMQASGGSVTANAGTNLNTSALSTSALQGTNSATTAHTCSVAGFSEIGCLGQIDDDIKGSVAAGTARIGYTSDDPCTQLTKTNFTISTTSGTVQLVAPSGSTQVYICSLVTVGATASIQNLVGGTGATCTTGTPVAMLGSTTAANGMSFAANGGFTFGNGGATISRTTTAGHGVCLIQNATAQISGGGTYVQQ